MLHKQVAEFHEALFKEIGESQQTFNDHLQRSDTELIIEKELLNVQSDSEEGALLGYALIKILKDEIEIGWLGVIHDKRRCGIGSRLIQKIINRFQGNGKIRALCFSRNRYKSAMRLYLKHEFNITGTFKGMDGDLMIKFERQLNSDSDYNSDLL